MADDEQRRKPSSKRKVKEFPSELACVTDEDRSKFGMALEVDSNPKSKTFGTEFLVVQTVNVIVNEKEVKFDLRTLVVDHLRRLCKNVGVINCGSFNKFDCRKALATFLKYQDKLHNQGLSASSAAARLTSTIIRAVNVVFSDHFRDDFLSVNDRKSRRDHELRNTHKLFWYQASMAHNTVVDRPSDIVNVSPTKTVIGSPLQEEDDMVLNCTDEFSRLMNRENDPHLADLLTDRSLNLMDFDPFETAAFRKKILDLFKIRRCMKENMTVSGTHDNDAWNFVECAMAKTPGFTKVAVYYFYKQCELVEDIDCHFQPFLDGSMIGDTTSLNSSDSECGDDDDDEESSAYVTAASSTCSTSTKKRKRQRKEQEEDEKGAGMKMLLEQGKLTIHHMEEAAKRDKLRFDLDAKKDKFFARLEVAKAMGDTEELEKLKREANEMP